MGMIISPYGSNAGTVSSPLDITGCSFWYDSSDLTTLFQDQAGTTPVTTTTQPVGRWNDKSGNSRVLSQGTAGARPTYSAALGYNGVDFDGLNDVLQHALTNTPVSTVFAAAGVRSVNSDSFAGLISNLSDQAAGVDFVWVRDSGLNQWLVSQSTGGGLADSSHQWVNRVNTTAWSVATMAIYAIDGTGHASAVLPTGMNVGNDRNLVRYLAANVYELIGYDTILSSTDRNRVENYLAARYGVTL